MSYQRASFTLHSVAPDRIPQDAPAEAWSDATNIFFRNNETRRVSGDVPSLPGAELNARTCVYVEVSGRGYWVYATNAGVFVHDGTTNFDITPASWLGNEDATFTSCVLNGVAYVNASDRDPVYWDGIPTNPAQLLPDWPLNGRCLALRAHKNFLFAIGFLSEGDQRVRWSDAAEAGTVPQFWTPAADNLAGFVDLAPLSSPCLEGETLRDNFLIYKNESIYALDFIGGNAIFNVRSLFSEHGIVNTNALTRGIDDVHLFCDATGDVMITDGVKVQSVLDGRAQRTFYTDYTQNKQNVFAATTLAREKTGILGYAVQGGTTMTKALLFDFQSGDISFRDLPDVLCMAQGGRLQEVGELNSWDGDLGEWDSDASTWNEEVSGQTLDDVLIGGAFGFAIASDPGVEDFLTGPVVAVAEKEGMAFGVHERRKMIGRIWPRMTGRNGDTVEFRVGGQEITGGAISLQSPVTYTIGQNEPLDVFVQGRFLYMRVSSEGGQPWRMSGFDLEYRYLGDF